MTHPLTTGACTNVTNVTIINVYNTTCTTKTYQVVTLYRAGVQCTVVEIRKKQKVIWRFTWPLLTLTFALSPSFLGFCMIMILETKQAACGLCGKERESEEEKGRKKKQENRVFKCTLL